MLGWNVLVTGGSGFIGGNLVKRLLECECHVTVFDQRTPNNNLYDPKEVDFVMGSLAEAEDLEKLENRCFDVIFHQGAIVDTTVTDEELVQAVNIDSFKYLIRLAKNSDATLVYASSAATYGHSLSPQRVGEGEFPMNLYGRSKLEMDRITREELVKDPFQNIIGLRYFNVYGRGESHKGNMASMIYQLSQQMEAGNRPRIFRDGSQSRDFVYIDDVVNANIQAALSHSRGIYNVGSGKSRTFNEVIACLNHVLGTNYETEYIENPYSSFFQKATCADIEDTKYELNYEPEYDLEDGIRDYMEL
jgi:ADP-L-glycero-D-manno-heptose 6-epimerase